MNSERAILRIIQTTAADRLLSMPEFATVGVVSADEKDLDAKLSQAINVQGMGVVVAAVKARNNEVDSAGPYFDRINCVAQVYEKVPVNRRPGNPNYKTGQEIAEYAASYLQAWLPDNFNECYVVDSIEMLQTSAGGGVAIWEVSFHTQGGFTAQIPAVATPVIDASAQPVTITDTTPGAAIFYTTDGSFPSPRNTNATIYTAPFTCGLGLTVKAVAYLAGYKCSGISQAVSTTGTDWTYIGDAGRYRSSYFQVKGSNEIAFHLVNCQTFPGSPILAVGDAVAESGGSAPATYEYFGSRVRVGTDGIQLFCDTTQMWYPFLVIPMFGGNVLSLGDGIAGTLGTASGVTVNWGTETQVSDAGLRMLNTEQQLWYLVMPDLVDGNLTLKLTQV